MGGEEFSEKERAPIKKPPEGQKGGIFTTLSEMLAAPLAVPTKPNKPLDTPAFFDKHKEGKFSPAELASRTIKIAPGVQIFRDVGMTFYYVQKGDTLMGIQKKFAKLPKAVIAKYPDLQNVVEMSRKGLNFFNIPAKVLQIGMRLPLPIPENRRVISEKIFIEHCKKAIEEMSADPVYGQKITDLVTKVGEKEIITVMLAVAKVEAGPKAIGQFSTQRYEPGHQCFSYTFFHVLMEGAGLKARKNLQLTEGQIQHPRNSAKLFLAFLIEKTGTKIAQYFPLDENLEAFASMYNGGNWKETNPTYDDKISAQYKKAKELVDEG